MLFLHDTMNVIDITSIINIQIIIKMRKSNVKSQIMFQFTTKSSIANAHSIKDTLII